LAQGGRQFLVAGPALPVRRDTLWFWLVQASVVMKVILKYEESENKELHMTLRLTLPQKYLSGQCREVVKLFVDHYNKKHAEEPLDMEALHLKIVGGDHLDSEERVRDVMAGGDECYLLPKSMFGAKVEKTEAVPPTPVPSAPAPRKEAPAPSAPKPNADGKVRCKNFGCQRTYDPEGEPQSCTHHKAPPIFHETKKWWSCCSDRKTDDFDDFMAIPGCTTTTCTATPEGQGTKRALGGCDLRAANAPTRLDADAPIDPRIKLEAVRKGLVAVGVDSALFEKVFSQLMAETGDLDKVVEQFKMRLAAVLNNKDL